jgi:X-Pro dipeptidyl-peptidase (S15 family)
MKCRFAWLLVIVHLICAAAQAQKSDINSREVRTSQNSEENWTELSVAKLGMNAEPSLSAGEVDFKDFTRELVRLQWRSDDPVDIYIVRPRGVQKPPVILYLYNYLADSKRFTDEQWCRTATESGFAAVGFVSALSGERYHGRPMKQWFVSELPESLATTTHDVQMILDHLETRKDLNATRVGMYGQGSGATIAILAASVDTRIVALDLLNPWGDWPDWMKSSGIIPSNERADFLRPQFLSQTHKLDPIEILPTLKTQAIRIQQLDDDPVTAASARQQIAAAAPHRDQVIEYKDAATFRKAWDEKQLWGWVKQQLQASSSEVTGAASQ